MQGLKINRINLMRFCGSTFVISVFFQNLSFWLSHHCHHHWRCRHDLILEVDKPQKSDSYHKLDEGSVFLLVVRCEKRRSSGNRSSTELIPERYDAESYLDIAGRREM